MNAEKFSILACPQLCLLSAGLSEILTEKKVITAATRSNPEWRASDRRPRLPVRIPIMNLNDVRKIAAKTDKPATLFFHFAY